MGLFYKKKRVYSLRKEKGQFYKELGRESFSYRVDPFSEGDWSDVKHPGCHRSCLLVVAIFFKEWNELLFIV